MALNFTRYMALLAVLALAAACGESEFKVTSLQIYPTELAAEVGDTTQLSFALVYEGGDFDDPDLISPEWTSTDETVAQVDTTGLVAALTPGEAVVTVAIGGVEASCDVTVTEGDDDEEDDEDS